MQTNIIRKETAHTINGVSGRLFTLRRPPAPWKAGTFANQTWVSQSRNVTGYGETCNLTVNIRFDDSCKNGRNSFAITGDIQNARGRDVAGGCLHDDIARVFPELAPLIKWHLCATDGPMHYVANTLHFASDRDCWGRAKGEPSAFARVVYFGSSPVHHKIGGKFAKFISEGSDFKVVAIPHKQDGSSYKYADKYTFSGFCSQWHECPFDDEQTAREWCEAVNSGDFKIDTIATAFSEGKTREFDKARNAGVWPDATDDQLSMPRAELEAVLVNRLPALIAEFRADIERAGFMWECPEVQE